MFTSADRPYFGWKNPNKKISKNVRFFITGGAVRFIITKINNATLNAHLGRRSKSRLPLNVLKIKNHELSTQSFGKPDKKIHGLTDPL